MPHAPSSSPERPLTERMESFTPIGQSANSQQIDPHATALTLDLVAWREFLDLCGLPPGDAEGQFQSWITLLSLRYPEHYYELRLPAERTTDTPGSLSKIDELSKRHAAGEALWHPDDLFWESRLAEGLARFSGRGMNGAAKRLALRLARITDVEQRPPAEPPLVESLCRSPLSDAG